MNSIKAAQPTLKTALSRNLFSGFMLCAGISLALYLLLPRFVAGMNLAEPSMAGEVFGWVKGTSLQSLAELHDSGSHTSASIWFLSLCTGLFVIYCFLLRLVRGATSVRLQALIFGTGVLFLAVQWLAPVLLSSDVYAYAMYGRVLGIYHSNPYSTTAPISSNDPFFLMYGETYLPSIYGPLWTLISAGVALIGGENIGLTVLLFRVVASLAALACAAFIWASLRRFAPERATQGLVFFLWNPLVIIESGMGAHNDITMMALVLSGVWLHLRGWHIGTTIALTLSALVKILTGMLVPLYVLLLLRQAATWRTRAGILIRSGLAAGAVCIAAMSVAHSGTDLPAQHRATESDFYYNNFHELILKALRLGLGEDAETVHTSIYFQGWWLAAKTNALMYAQPDVKSAACGSLASGAKVIAVGPQKTKWAHVYDPATKQYGFVDVTNFSETSRPEAAGMDATTSQFEQMAMDWPTTRMANGIIRIVTWALFAAFGLLAAWRTSNFEEFLVWSTAALLASFYTVLTAIWPWYVIWALAIGALVNHRFPARLAFVLSMGVMTLNVTVGYMGGTWGWISEFRSLPAFVLPLVLALMLHFWKANNRFMEQ